jgi:MFS family permease
MKEMTRTPGALQGIMLLLPITMSVVGVSVLTPIVPLLLEQFKGVANHEYLVLGGVLTMPSIWMLLFSPVAGWLADRFGRRNLLIVSMIVYAFVGTAPVVLDNLYLIIISRMGVGICESIVGTVSTTMISDYFTGRARERWLASQTAVASVSALGVILLGGMLGSALGWRGPFYLYLYSLPLALLVRATVWEPPRSEAGQDGATASAVFPMARTFGICAITLLASISFYTVITKNAQALNVLGVTDPAQIGKYTMLASIGVPLGTFIYWALANLPIAWLLFIDFGLVGIGFFLMGQAGSPSSYVLGSFINQIGCGLVLPTMLVWVTRGVEYAVRGRVNGLWQAAFAIGQFLSGMVVTFLAGYLNGLLASLSVMGEVIMGCAVIGGIAGFVARMRRGATVGPS